MRVTMQNVENGELFWEFTVSSVTSAGACDSMDIILMYETVVPERPASTLGRVTEVPTCK